MKIEQDFPLDTLNTFGLSSHAQSFCQIETEDELEKLVQSALFLQQSVSWLGGGSNIILAPTVNSFVIQLCNKGIELVEDKNDTVLVKAQSGEVWHEFVLQTLSLGYSGLENLSLIPGYVGAAPVQNIGAYGVEVKDRIHSVICFDTYSRKWQTFSKVDCQFKYRDSFFKHAENGRYVIWSVIFELSKRFIPNIHYGDLEEVSNQMSLGQALTAQTVSDAVCSIRQQKLPNPHIMGNVGSFFHNPIVTAEVAEDLKQRFPNMPQYGQEDGRVKLAAGWLIDQAGLKGHQIGNAGVHLKQALVLVNLGGATHTDVLDLSQHVQDTIFKMFGIALHPEPNFW